MALQIRRGTDAERLSITPEAGEPVFTLDTKEFFIGDGTTQGGVLVSGTLVNETTPALGTDLDLNGNNIVGTGNINIAGTITATGNINLGDGADDNVIVGGQIASALTPDADLTYDLGGTSARWNEGYINTVRAGLVVANSVEGNTYGTHIGSVELDDSSLAVNGTTGEITVQGTSLTTDGTYLSVGNTSSVANLKVVGDTNDTVLVVNGTTGVTAFNFPTVGVQAHRGTAALPTAPNTADTLGAFAFNAYTGSAYVVAGAIGAKTEGVIGLADAEVPTTITIGKVSSVLADNGDFLSVASTGKTSAPVFKTGSYATGAEPTNPEAGDIIFDSTTNKHKGWDGTAWQDFY